MSVTTIERSAENSSGVRPVGTNKISFTLRGLETRSIEHQVVLECPSDAIDDIEKDIRTCAESLCVHLPSYFEWSYAECMGRQLDDVVDIQRGVAEGESVVVKVARTIDGQLVVLAN